MVSGSCTAVSTPPDSFTHSVPQMQVCYYAFGYNQDINYPFVLEHIKSPESKGSRAWLRVI
jgi:hypothetical protein